MVTLDFRPAVVTWSFWTCAIKNMHNKLYLLPNQQNSRILLEIGLKKRNGGSVA